MLMNRPLRSTRLTCATLKYDHGDVGDRATPLSSLQGMCNSQPRSTSFQKLSLQLETASTHIPPPTTMIFNGEFVSCCIFY